MTGTSLKQWRDLANQQAELLCSHFADGEAALADSVAAQVRDAILEIAKRGAEFTPRELGLLTRTLADSARGAAEVRNYQADLQRRAAEADEADSRAARQSGLSDSFAEQLIRKVLGVVA